MPAPGARRLLLQSNREEKFSPVPPELQAAKRPLLPLILSSAAGAPELDLSAEINHLRSSP